jgi:2-oxoisovalerate dehydrogenase E1 component subunit beta
MAGAINTALRDAVAQDEQVVILGEDVGRLGGMFGVTAGIAEAFGTDRCFDTPLAESGIVGFAVGLAIAGFRPVVEIQYDAYAYPAFEQILSHVAKLPNRTRRSLTLPMVIRIPYGGGFGGVEHHCDSSEAYYACTPGLKVATPATAADGYALLRAAIDDPDPVIFFEPKRFYSRAEDVTLLARGAPLGEAVIRREGTEATLVAYGPAVQVALEAAEQAAADGVQLEVIDLRTLVPLDEATVCASVRRTGRCVIVHEAPVFGGPGAEIAATIQQRCFSFMRAPVQRVGALNAPYPPPQAERYYLPQPESVLDAVRQALGGWTSVTDVPQQSKARTPSRSGA